MEEIENLDSILVKILRESDYLEDPVINNRISSAQMLRKATRLLQTPDVRRRTHTQGVQTAGTAEQYLVAGLTGCRDLCTACSG